MSSLSRSVSQRTLLLASNQPFSIRLCVLQNPSPIYASGGKGVTTWSLVVRSHRGVAGYQSGSGGSAIRLDLAPFSPSPCAIVVIDCDVPISGTASDVGGIVSATSCRKTVSDSRIVTPAAADRAETRLTSLPAE